MGYHFLFLLLLPSCLLAQVQPTSETRVILQVELTNDAGKLAILETAERKIINERAGLRVSPPELEDADLIINFSLNKEKGFSDPIIRLEYARGMAGGEWMTVDSLAVANRPVTEGKKTTSGRLIWRDVVERYLDYGQPYRIRITLTRVRNYPCPDTRPQFGARQQWPYYAGWAIGGGLLGLSEVFRHSSDQAYTDYEALWANGESKNAAQRAFDDAESDRKISKGLAIAGWSVVGVNTVAFLTHLILSKKGQKNFDRFCQPGTGGVSWRIKAGPEYVGIQFQF